MTTEKICTDPTVLNLRKRAEERLDTSDEHSASGKNLVRLVHELQVHQIELELQNEELRQARAEVEDGLECYAELYDFAPLCYVTLNTDATILQANLAAGALLGLPQSQLPGGHFGFFLAEGSRRAFNALLKEVVTHQDKRRCEVDIPDGTHSLRHVSLTATSLRTRFSADGSAVILVAMEDVTERQTRERKLRQTISLLHATQSAARLGTCVLDITTGGWTRSAVLNDILGVDESFENSIEGLLSLIDSADRARIVADLAAVQNERTDLDRVYRINRHSDNEPRSIWAHGTLEFNTQGNPVRIICTMQDITEQEALRASTALAEHANHAKDQFLALLSHELRTPLATILLRAEMLQRETMTLTKAKRSGLMIAEAVQAQSRLIEDLLDMSRIASGKLRLEREQVDLAHLVDSVVKTARDSASSRHIAIQTDLEEPRGQVYGDPVRLQQVLWNLLNNAIKFTPPEGQMTVSLKSAGKYVELRVADTGKGITQEFLPYLFNRFSQADSGSTRQHGGLGLGLAIVHDLVVAHKGTVTAESPGLDQGATFTVRLPMTCSP